MEKGLQKKEKAADKFKGNPLKIYTCRKLADLTANQFISDEETFKILNNGFDKFGFSLAVEKKLCSKISFQKLKLLPSLSETG